MHLTLRKDEYYGSRIRQFHVTVNKAVQLREDERELRTSVQQMAASSRLWNHEAFEHGFEE